MDAISQPEQPTPSHSGWLTLGVTNLILLLMISIVSGGAIYFLFIYQPKLDPEFAQQFARQASDRLNKNSDAIEREALQVARQTWPIVRHILVEQARADYPEIAEKLQSESTAYFTNVEAAFLAKVKARYHDYLMEHRKILTSEFPEHATRENVQRVLQAFEATFAELVERYYLDQFRHEAARTEAVWRRLPPARQPDDDEPALEQQLAQTAQDWIVTISRPPRE